MSVRRLTACLFAVENRGTFSLTPALSRWERGNRSQTSLQLGTCDLIGLQESHLMREDYLVAGAHGMEVRR